MAKNAAALAVVACQKSQALGVASADGSITEPGHPSLEGAQLFHPHHRLRCSVPDDGVVDLQKEPLIPAAREGSEVVILELSKGQKVRPRRRRSAETRSAEKCQKPQDCSFDSGTCISESFERSKNARELNTPCRRSLRIGTRSRGCCRLRPRADCFSGFGADRWATEQFCSSAIPVKPVSLAHCHWRDYLANFNRREGGGLNRLAAMN